MKYAWINAHREEFALSELCAVLHVIISGYRARKGGGIADRQGLTDTQLLPLIESIHAELKGACRSPRMLRELRARRFRAGKERVERLIREKRHSWALQAPLQGQDLLQAQPARGRKPARARLHPARAESGLGLGYQLSLER